MNPFKRNKNKSEDELLEFFEKNEESIYKPHAPHVLTPDEIIADDFGNDLKVQDNHPFEELRKRMLDNAENSDQQETAVSPTTDTEETAFAPSFNVNVNVFDTEESANQEQEETDNIEQAQAEEQPEEEQLQISALEEVSGPYPEKESQQEQISLFETCMPYIKDTDGQMPESEPLYTLEKVESILGIEPKEEIEESPESNEETIIFEAIKTDEPDISDIDAVIKENDVQPQQEMSFTKTMPVIITPENLEESREIDISSQILKAKEPSKNLLDTPAADDDSDFTPPVEYNSKGDTRRVRLHLLTERRNKFLAVLVNLLSLVILGIVWLAAKDTSFDSHNGTVNTFCYVAAILCIIANIDAFKDIASLFTKRTKSSVLFCLSALGSVFGLICADTGTLACEICFYITLTFALSGLLRSFFLLKKSIYVYKNFRLISGANKKQGVMLIDDAPTTFAMAHRAIDGDALIAAPQKTEFVKNFMKNSFSDRDLDGKARIAFVSAFVFSSLFSVFLGIYKNSFLGGAISFTGLSSLFCPLALFAVNTLPLDSAINRLNKFGGAIFSIKKARLIEQSNAVVIDSDAIFPKSTVNLHNLKILSPNDLEETIAVAAAITKTVSSPLYPIFKAAMDTNNTVIIPEADSIKYEERLGITGWVGDSRIFIGNRALMLAHEIEVPDMQVDKDLLVQGYFPVYLARDGKACALLSVSYKPNEQIAKELRRISNMGMTILVNNCDQNLSEEMICDYFDLYSDSVKVMSGSGVHMYKNATCDAKELDCGAVVTGKAEAIAGVVSSSIKIKRAVNLLTVAVIISTVLGAVIFSYGFFGAAAVSNLRKIFIYQLISFLLTVFSYLFTKP